jgi:hypothetical protein
MWKPVLIVSKDFVCTAGIQNGQLIHAMENFLQLAGEGPTSPMLLKPVEAFFQGLFDGGRQRLARLCRDLSG